MISNAHPGISCLGLEQHVCQWQRQLLAQLANEATSHSVVAALCSLPVGAWGAVQRYHAAPCCCSSSTYVSGPSRAHQSPQGRGNSQTGQRSKAATPKACPARRGSWARGLHQVWQRDHQLNDLMLLCPVDVTAASSLLLVNRHCYLEPAEVSSAAAVAIGAIRTCYFDGQLQM